MDVQQFFNYGVPTGILVLILFAVWKMGNRLIDATINNMSRQASATEKTADAMSGIKEAVSHIDVATAKLGVSVSQINDTNNKSKRAMQSIISAVTELTPEDKQQVKKHLIEATNHLK